MMRYVVVLALLFTTSLFGMIGTAAASNYSSGSYGTCTYDLCSISLSSGATTTISVTPASGSTLCTVQSNAVTATTDSSTGYLVTINNADTTTSLAGPSGATIASVSGTAASPVVLSANTWGYRVDSVAGFGSGPTSSQTNSSIPSVTFAATPTSASAGGTIRTTSSADITPVTTSVWFGACADTTTIAGSYSDSVIFTAVVNP